MKVLLTGFERFGELDINPTEVIVHKLEERTRCGGTSTIITEVLPTEFIAAGKRIRKLIRTVEPKIIISLGVTAESRTISLERVALNLDDSPFPDNAGLIPEGKLIADDGPIAYFSTLPLLYLKKELQEKGIPVEISNHAGTFVCNHVFYLTLHQIEKLGMDTICGFIHFPLLSGIDGPVGHHKINLGEHVFVIEYCLKLLKDFKR